MNMKSLGPLLHEVPAELLPRIKNGVAKGQLSEQTKIIEHGSTSAVVRFVSADDVFIADLLLS